MVLLVSMLFVISELERIVQVFQKYGPSLLVIITTSIKPATGTVELIFRFRYHPTGSDT